MILEHPFYKPQFDAIEGIGASVSFGQTREPDLVVKFNHRTLDCTYRHTFLRRMMHSRYFYLDFLGRVLCKCRTGAIPAIFSIGCIIVACFSLYGCGLSSENKESADGQLKQTFIGHFTDALGTPERGLTVTIANTNSAAMTDPNGRVEISESTSITGDAELLLSGDWGMTSVLLEGIPEDTQEITLDVVVDHEAQLAEVTRLEFDGVVSGGDSTPTPAPPDSGGKPTDPDKPDRTPTPQGKPTPRPQPTVRPKPTVKPKPTKQPTGGGGSPANCLICHGDRGGPRCGDAAWEAIHRAVYKCTGAKGAELPLNFDLVQSLRKG